MARVRPRAALFLGVGVAVQLGYGLERPQFSRVGVVVWLVYRPERLSAFETSEAQSFRSSELQSLKSSEARSFRA